MGVGTNEIPLCERCGLGRKSNGPPPKAGSAGVATAERMFALDRVFTTGWKGLRVFPV